MPKAERLSLPHVVDVGEIVGLLREHRIKKRIDPPGSTIDLDDVLPS